MSSLKVERDTRHVTVINDHLQLGFLHSDRGAWQVATLRHPSQPNNWMVESTNAPLWRARFLRKEQPSPRPSPDKAGHEATQQWVDIDSLSGPASLEVQQSPELVSLSFTWSNVVVDPTDESVDVVINVSLDDKSPVSHWTANVINRSSHLGLWQFDFPLLHGLRGDSRMRLITPDGWGVQIAHPAQHENVYLGNYPSGHCVMQLLALTDGQYTVYLATEDQRAFYKQFSVVGDRERDAIHYEVRQLPSGMGQPSHSYETPFSTAVGVLAGSWESAARRYRQWALTAPWTAKGRLAARADTAQWLQDTVLWTIGSSRHADNIGGACEELVAFAEYFDVPTAVHWYGWHEIPFDDHYPEYFPARSEFKEAVARVQEAGVRVMPYINGRLWDPRTDSWLEDDGFQACAKTLDQQSYVESYATKVDFAVMCPSTPLWQEKISTIVDRLAKEFGVDGVYIDQIGAARPQLCFDRSHGHGVGGGDYWVRGYDKIIKISKKLGRQSRRDFVLTTEDAAEAYGAELDAFLMCNSTRPDLVPLYPMVYAGLFVTFGRYIFEEDMEDPTSFRTKVGQILLWGAQLGWMAPGFILEPQHAASADFLRDLAHVKARNHEYLTLGELVDPTPITNNVPKLETRWCMWNPKNDYKIEPLHPVTLPSVQGAVWKHYRGDSRALFLVNMSERDQRVTWSIDLPDPSGYGAYEQDGGHVVDVGTASGALSGATLVPRLSARVIELQRNKSLR